MKRRMKLTEKELAIGMWLYIKMNIANRDNDSITILKYDYLSDHHMSGKWKCNCILCDKHDGVCLRCPLVSCSSDHKTLWAVVTNTVGYGYPITIKKRLDACDKIIKAIQKDIPDDYVSC